MERSQNSTSPYSATTALLLALSLACIALAGCGKSAVAQLPPASPAAPPPEYRDEKLGLVFPTVQNFHREPTHVFQDTKAGYGVSYEFELPEDVSPTPATPQGTRVTLDVYNLGLEKIDAGAESKELLAEFARSVAAIQALAARGIYRTVAEEGPADVAPLAGTQSPPFRRQTFLITAKDGRQLVSTLYLAGYANHFLKIRVTMPKRQRAEGEKEAARLLAAFAASLRP